MAFNNWPYTNFQDLNLGWILGKLGVVERLAIDSAASVSQYDARITANTNAIEQLGIDLDSISDVAKVFVNSDLEAYYRGNHITGSELFSVFQSHGTLPFVEYNGEVYMLDSVSNAGDMRFSMGHTVDTFNELVIRHIMIPAQSYNAAYSITNVSAGGGSSGNVFAVVVREQSGSYVADHTYSEIISQMQNGRIPVLLVSFGSNPVSYQICGMGRNATRTVSGQTIQEICFADPSWMTDSGNNNVGEWFIDANNYVGHIASLKQLATLDNIIQFVNDGITTNALIKTQQTLTAAEKAQVKQNLGITDGGGGGGSVTVDSALSGTSTNPVQNKVVKAALDGKQDTLTAGQNVTISGNTISADVDSAEIASSVGNWLETNVDPVGSAVVVDSSLSVEGAAADAKATGDEFNDVKSAFNQLETTTTVMNWGNNLFDPTKKSAEDRIINWTNGEIANGTGYYVTDYIPVRKDVKYGFTGYGAFFAFYNSQKTFVSETETNDIKELDGGESTTTKYSVSVTWFTSPIDGFLRVSIPKYIIDNNRGVFTPIKTSADIIGTDFPAYTDGNDLKNSAEEEIEETNRCIDNMSMNIKGQKNALVYHFDLSASSTYVQTVYVEDMCNYRLCFFGKLSGSFSGQLIIGKGANLDMGGSIWLDNRKVYYYPGGGSSASREQEHGIEQFKDYIGISIDLGYTPAASVYIYTNGYSYKWELPYFRSWRGTLTVYTSQTAFADCTFSYTCAGLMKDTWLYGDSYFANSGTDRWTAYLVSNGYKNYALNAYPGRNSQEALRSLKADLDIKKYPKRIVWCLGMNDPDTTEVNANWLAAVTELKEICQEHYIELILATIPLVPNVSCNNSYKNAYVKDPTTGCRYIDFANAVNTGVGGNWYDGMINSDNIHPNQEGAIALYNQAISDVPELLT